MLEEDVPAGWVTMLRGADTRPFAERAISAAQDRKVPDTSDLAVLAAEIDREELNDIGASAVKDSATSLSLQWHEYVIPDLPEGKDPFTAGMPKDGFAGRAAAVAAAAILPKTELQAMFAFLGADHIHHTARATEFYGR